MVQVERGPAARARETIGAQASPFTAFNFKVVFTLDGDVLCDAAFAECDGIEMTMQPKTYQEGGNNTTAIQLVGPVTYGTLTLKRGMTRSFDLWNWFDRVVQRETNLRIDGQVMMQTSDRGLESGSSLNAIFILSRCVPIKLKAPGLNAKEGAVAIEELQVAYESLKIERPR